MTNNTNLIFFNFCRRQDNLEQNFSLYLNFLVSVGPVVSLSILECQCGFSRVGLLS